MKFINPLVVYHDNCQDGFCSAWLFHRAFKSDKAKILGTPEFIADTYGQDPKINPEYVKDRDVFIVDFSYPKEYLEKINEAANSLLVLDHHKTSQDELNDLEFAHFDLLKCGSRLAWEWICDNDLLDEGLKHNKLLDKNLKYWSRRIAYPLVDYVEDRDLWKWELPFSKQIHAWLACQPFKFDTWDWWVQNDFMRLVSDRNHPNSKDFYFIKEGEAKGSTILEYQNQVIKDHVSNVVYKNIGGYNVPCVNATVLISEIGAKLAETHPFGVCWFQRKDGKFVYSLRSNKKDGVDVSKVAKKIGGGGHPTAAGFTFDSPP